MLKNWKKKLIAILLIFTMTFSNFALVGKTYAATFLEGIFGNKQEDAGDTGNSNVEFDAYFKTGQDSKTSKEISSDVKSSDLLVGATVKVKNSGYLKDAKILFGDGKELNFVINNEVQVPIQNEKEVSGEVSTRYAENEIGSEEVVGVSLDNDENQTNQNEDVVGKPVISDEDNGVSEISEETNENSEISEENEQETMQNNSNQGGLEENVPNQDGVEETASDQNVLGENNSNSEVQYETKNIAESNDKVQSFENNELNIVQLNANSEMNVEFPISYEYKKYVEESMISKTNKIKFEGVYINDDAKEIKVSKVVDLKLSWEDSRELKTSSEITKYIGFNQNGVNGIILQNSIVVDNSTDNASLPIKNSNVEVSVPEIDGVKPDTINVVAKSLLGTTGKQNDEVVFGTENWKYDSDNNKITINVENKSELISTQNENEVLKDETAPMKDMYYSESGVDNYLITYTYKNVAISERQITTSIKAELNEFGTTKLSSENEITSDLKNEVGNIVTYTNETTTNSISKGYTYLNYNNEENKYEMEVDDKLIFNVSYKDIVENLYYNDLGSQYISKTGEVFNQDDLYYKNLKLSKENFTNMLGDDGVVNIYSNGQLLFTINKDTAVNEDGTIEFQFENTVKNIQIETSKPINDGNLIFSVARAYSNVSYGKDFYKNFESLTINTTGRAKYIYLDELVDIGNSNLNIKLDDTKTEATLEIGQDNLSTLAINNNVELKIELNNESVNSDVYGDSRFQIKLPEYVESVEVTDYNMVYGEGLQLAGVQGFEQDGNTYINIDVTGKQNQLSSGIISHGTNIVLNANIKVDLFAPASEGNFELTYVNSDATNYSEEGQNAGLSIATITYSAPSGVVSVNSISGYSEDKNKTITSVNQGKVQDEIAIYSDSKVIKDELTIMNNEDNDISDIAILGRVPFDGVKDIETGEELGTNVNTKMVSRIMPEDLNETDFKYYYSENGEATRDLNDGSNGWTDELTTLDNVKSFLIVPANPEYKMEKASKLRFTYEYEVPANLEHNAEIFGTFVTYYTNNTDVATISDVSKANLVGLITGEGPQFNITTTTNKEKLNEFEELEITTTLKNTGKTQANDIVVTVPIPEYTTYVSNYFENENVSWSNDNSKVEFKLPTLEVDDTATFKITVRVNQFFSEIKDKDVVEIDTYSLVTATDLDALLKSEGKKIKIERAEMRVSIDNNYLEDIMYKGKNLELYVRVQNLTNEELHNGVTTMQIPNGFNFVKASVLGFSEDNATVIDVKQAEYNDSTRTVTWKIGDIRYLDIVSLKVELEVADISNNVTKSQVFVSANAKADGTNEYSSGNVEFMIGKPSLTITQTTSTMNSYVKEGETINYQINVKNEGSVTAKEVRLKDFIPEGLVAKSISYVSEGIAVNKDVSEKDNVTVGASIPAGDTLTVDVAAVATSLNGLGERSVTNKAVVSGQNIDEVKSNEITHIVESSGNVVSAQGEHSVGIASSSSETANISKTYKITGVAWLDKDRDGMRGDSEQLMKGIVATLVDSDNGTIKQSVTTNSKGEYTFTGVKNGNYIIIFDYDTVLYTVTVYQKEDIAQNVNSDVITTKIEQDGNLRNGAVTRVVTVEDVSVSNIDIGLIEAMKFDLNLDMGISKITTNTSKGTETKTYDNSKLTKTEIASKEVDGSKVYIEYTLTLKNEGETEGFVKKIADYIPEGMEFNSGMNQDWYTGSDGILYTTSLSDVEIKPGETKTLKLVLSKEMTGDNLGTVSNTAEIVDDYNIYGVSDLDSTPNNKAQNEDDFARTDSYLSVKTGEVFIYISLIITTVILVGIVVSIVTIKIKSRIISKGGV